MLHGAGGVKPRPSTRQAAARQRLSGTGVPRNHQPVVSEGNESVCFLLRVVKHKWLQVTLGSETGERNKLRMNSGGGA